MGSCSSNHEADGGNHGSGFNPGHNGGFNPGNNDHNGGFNPGNESHRPHSRQAGNMAPNPADPSAEAPAQNEAAAPQQAANAEEAKAQATGDLANTAMGALASPVLGGMQPPAPQMEMSPQGAPQQPAAPQGGRPWIDYDPRTNKPMLMANGQHGQAPMSNMGNFQDAAEYAEEFPPQAGQPYGNQLIIGAVSGDISGGHIVQDGHWEEFEAANNVMLLEDFEKTLHVD